ncbi:MAG TPA: glycosyltransferase [Blastocatellia bacterium]|nr:glycosyltransferase [Blastocatellia bacterium]
MKSSALYICYASVTEPLVHTQVLPYIGELGRRGVHFTLFTFEPKGVSASELREAKQQLAQLGVEWRWFRYHKRPSLAATVFDILVGALASLVWCARHRVRIVHARSHVAGAMALVVKLIRGSIFIFDLRGLLAEEYVDAGHWREESLKFKLTKRMERVFFRRADALVMLTLRIKEELIESDPTLASRGQDITVIPCCIDEARFNVTAEQREEYRRERNWNGRTVLAYAGKLGGWYLTREMVSFFATAHRLDPNLFFQILTHGDAAELRQSLIEQGIQPKDFDIRFERPDRLPLVLAASDAGISFIKPCYSKLASSPTKVGEYLAAGLAVVGNSGIGDCDAIFQDARLGVSVKQFTEAEYEKAARGLSVTLSDPAARPYRRRYAKQEFSLETVGGPRYSAIYESLVEPRPATMVSTTNINAD